MDKLKVWVSGAMTMDVICLFATVRPVEPITLPDWAFTVATPKETPVSRPVPLMVATLVGLVLQVTLEVTSPVELSPKVAVAEYCWVTPGATVALAGATCSEVMELEDGKNCPHPATAIRIVRTRARGKMSRNRCTGFILSLVCSQAKRPPGPLVSMAAPRRASAYLLLFV